MLLERADHTQLASTLIMIATRPRIAPAANSAIKQRNTHHAHTLAPRCDHLLIRHWTIGHAPIVLRASTSRVSRFESRPAHLISRIFAPYAQHPINRMLHTPTPPRACEGVGVSIYLTISQSTDSPLFPNVYNLVDRILCILAEN